MSFSSDIKEELVRIRLKSPALRLSQLAGLIHGCGSLRLGRGAGAVCQSESLPVTKQLLSLSDSLFELEATTELKQQQHRSRPLYVVTLTGKDCERMLADCGVIGVGADGLTLSRSIPAALTATDELGRAFLRGLFLGSGSCMNPQRGYHLEMISRSAAFADAAVLLIERCGIPARRMERKERQIVYLKGDAVSAFLALIGASGGVLSFENVRIEKDVRNTLNRQSNCEDANLNKTIDTGLAQREAILLIDRRTGLDRLPPSLYEAAMLRLNHPDATLQQLADMAEIGKSGMNHRLARLMQIAKELQA